MRSGLTVRRDAEDVGGLVRRRGSGEGEVKTVGLLCEGDVAGRAEKLHAADGRGEIGIAAVESVGDERAIGRPAESSGIESAAVVRGGEADVLGGEGRHVLSLVGENGLLVPFRGTVIAVGGELCCGCECNLRWRIYQGFDRATAMPRTSSG